MEKFVETLIDQIIKEVCGEGERRVKLQAFSAGLVAVRGIRRVFITVYFFCFATFLSALSLFSTLFLLFDQFQAGEWNFLNPKLLFSLGVFVVSTLILAFTVREKRWTAAFKLEEKIADLENRERYRESRQPPVTEETLARLIDEALDRRLRDVDTDSDKKTSA